MITDDIATLAARIRLGGKNIAFTGAGISTESGIPDYRSQGGIWDKFRPVYFDEFMSSRAAREEYWRRWAALYPGIEAAAPNPAHRALADLHRSGLLDAVITQNIDGLHQRGGLPDEALVEVHGNAHQTICLECRDRQPTVEVLARVATGDEDPHCLLCNGLLKTTVVMFGEAMPPLEMQRAWEWSLQADAVLAVGSTLSVFPAASIPLEVAGAGHPMVILNMGPTELDALAAALRELARQHKATVMIGRSHAIHGEPITFGFKVAGWLAEVVRNQERLERLETAVSVGQISGAMGTYANTDPRVEAIACAKLGLVPDTASTQVISRDRHAEYIQTLALVGAALERFSTEIRNMQRTDVLEVEENFAKGQKGSSAMPHKRNPVGCEQVSGLARLVRSNSLAALENVTLWHERDISHSSVERMIGPDATVTLDFALNRMAGVIEKLLVYPEAMQKNLDMLGGLVHSQRVLLGLTQAGMSREDSYKAVQRNAMKVWTENADFLAELKADPEVAKHIPEAELEALFDLGYHTKNLDVIFDRVFGE